jgi:hypothetical protein
MSVAEIARSTLTGWQPHEGTLVWQQMYNPKRPTEGSSISERVTSGTPYGPRRLMRLHGIVPDHGGPGITRWFLRDPDRPGSVSSCSWVESDWCVLEDASDRAEPDLFSMIGEA